MSLFPVSSKMKLLQVSFSLLPGGIFLNEQPDRVHYCVVFAYNRTMRNMSLRPRANRIAHLRQNIKSGQQAETVSS